LPESLRCRGVIDTSDGGADMPISDAHMEHRGISVIVLTGHEITAPLRSRERLDVSPRRLTTVHF